MPASDRQPLDICVSSCDILTTIRCALVRLIKFVGGLSDETGDCCAFRSTHLSSLPSSPRSDSSAHTWPHRFIGQSDRDDHHDNLLFGCSSPFYAHVRPVRKRSPTAALATRPTPLPWPVRSTPRARGRRAGAQRRDSPSGRPGRPVRAACSSDRGARGRRCRG